MAKMASMPIYGKTLWKSSSPEPRNIGPWSLVYSICDWRPTKFVQMMIPSWRLTFLRKGQIDIPLHFIWEKYWKVNFLRTTEDWCIIFGTDTLLTKNMEIDECQGQWVTFCFKVPVPWNHISKWLLLCNYWASDNHISYLASWVWGN